MIISVSDVHLGEDGCQSQDKQFSRFLDFVRSDALSSGGHLVLLGDIFDFWRKDSIKILEEHGDAVGKMLEFPEDIKIHYVVGNHDFYMNEIPEYFGENPFNSFGSTLNLNDVYKFRFIHGHQLEVMANPYTKDMKLYESLARRLSYHSGLTGKLADNIWHAISYFTQEEGEYLSSMQKDPITRLSGKSNAGDRIKVLAKSRCRCLMLGGPFDWLVYGHTHDRFLDQQTKTINTGSWGRRQGEKKMWYLKIEGGVPEQIEWK